MNSPKKIFARSVWVMLAIFFALLTVFIAVGTSIMAENSAVINSILGIDTYKKIQLETAGEEDMEYFKSDYIKYNADGTPMMQTDVDEEGGKYTHQVYDDIAMREASEKIAEQTAVEGTVLLWNDETASGKKALPLSADAGVSVFGVNQNKYVLLGNGSGSMSLDPVDGSLYNALRNKDVAVNSKLNTTYLQLLGEKEGDSAKYGVRTWNDDKSSNYACHFKVGEVPWNRISDVTNETIENYGDAAIMVVSRVAGEDYDISENIGDEAADGSNNHLELTAEEADVLAALNTLKSAGKVRSIILLMNTANPLQFGELLGEEGKEKYGVDACLWVGEGGTMSYVQIADVLTNTGGYVLSGRTTDTLLYNNTSAPSYANFGDYTWTEYGDVPDISKEYGTYYQTHNLKYLVYQEGVYVGYRYYETRYEDYVLGTGNAGGNAGATDGNGWNYSEEVAFPFGYGLGYTEFSYSDVTFSESDKAITVSVTVTNAGSTYSGKDVVQIYMQRPNAGRMGVEVPAIELVGFAKTNVLAPGADQTVTVTVDKENMRTYDAYGEGTYILERGDYYFSFGTNAHDALNNVLAVKATDEQKTRMDGAGNAAYVYKINVAAADTEIYSVSEESEKEVKIENRLSDADLNLYEGTKDDQSITYLSRSNWNGTYPTSAVSLKCTDETMVRDMQYGHEPEVKEGDEMPVYGTVTAPEGELTLAMFIDLEYDDPKWEDLLNQMTFTEQQWLCSYGLLKMAGATSVAAPGAKAIDGPGGVKSNNPVAGQQFGFPSPVVMAQTWDTALIERLGVAFAHEALHVGIAVLYAPGANIHRSLYSGRNWEYYSEDGFLSGKILSAEVTGLQSKGIMVMTKHFAFNDQERNRYGVATFFNEQSAREIYLRPFEIAVREGNMNGVMSSFNRIGCTWAGAHKGLLTDILRDEWNFIGMVETDSCTGNTFHMGDKWAKAEGLVAGNDLWMANGSETYFEDSKDNPTVMLALRKACHRILYNQLHSMAMNGVSTSTRIIKITPWWQIALTSAAVTMGVITLACVVMAVLSFIFASEKYKAWLRVSAAKKAEKAAAEAEASKAAAYSRAGGNAGGASGGADGESGDELPKKKSWFARHKKLLVLIGSIVIAVIVVVAIVVPVTTCGGATQPSPTPTPEPEPTPEVHVCEQVCPICGGCLDSECEDPVCASKCGAGKEAHVFEAEDAEIADGAATYAGYDIITSGDRTYIGNLNHNTGATVTFTVKAQAAATVSLVVTINRRNAQTVFTDRFGVSVNNGRDLDRPTIVPAYADQWTDESFMDFNLGCIDLVAGENTIRFTVLTTGD
ncbi:MAG TPA: fibronectin type III-like domain-contianing protein, partial [Firmicutes bacterium]|nr:fibronectin type III-like domain-contianing protein [Bacillota bacterium]